MGKSNLYDSLELREDYYSFNFILQLKRDEFFDDGIDSEEDLKEMSGPSRISRISNSDEDLKETSGPPRISNSDEDLK